MGRGSLAGTFYEGSELDRDHIFVEREQWSVDSCSLLRLHSQASAGTGFPKGTCKLCDLLGPADPPGQGDMNVSGPGCCPVGAVVSSSPGFSMQVALFGCRSLSASFVWSHFLPSRYSPPPAPRFSSFVVIEVKDCAWLCFPPPTRKGNWDFNQTKVASFAMTCHQPHR